jgi:hypothetical protein
MAQESQGGRSSSGRGGNRKRRYFRRKSGDAAAPGDLPGGAEKVPAKGDRSGRSGPAAQSAQPNRENAGERAARSGNRRRRKSKGRRSSESGREQTVTQAQEMNYVPPTSVYIYTHIVRPASSGAYEFRSEHFSKVGRTLEDYQIDVSPLFDEEARAAARPNMTEIFANFDLGEENDPPAPPAPPAAHVHPEHMDDNLLAVGGDTGLPTYSEDPYGAEDTAPTDEDLPDRFLDFSAG